MIFRSNTNNHELTLVVKVQTKKPQTILVMVADWKKPDTMYSRRKRTVNGEYIFIIKMPQSPRVAKIIVVNRNVKNKKDGDKTFRVSIDQAPLVRKFQLSEVQNVLTRKFVKFAQEWSENAGILGEGKYYDDDDKFQLNYVPVITDTITDILGNPQTVERRTPSRIDGKNYVIECSIARFKNYTIPGRMAILLHEYCHIFQNRTRSNEKEADLNSLLIYLGLGYPSIEAYEVWLEVFHISPSEGNEKRRQLIQAFIDHFDEIEFEIIK